MKDIILGRWNHLERKGQKRKRNTTSIRCPDYGWSERLGTDEYNSTLDVLLRTALRWFSGAPEEAELEYKNPTCVSGSSLRRVTSITPATPDLEDSPSGRDAREQVNQTRYLHGQHPTGGNRSGNGFRCPTVECKLGSEHVLLLELGGKERGLQKQRGR